MFLTYKVVTVMKDEQFKAVISEAPDTSQTNVL